MTCDFCHLPIPAWAGQTPTSEPGYCCYGCRLAADITRSRGEPGRVNWMLTRLGLAVFLSMSVMMFSMYLYRQHGLPDDPASAALSDSLGQVMRYLCLLFATPVFLLLAPPIFSNALDQARARILSTDALVVLGVGAAFAYSYVGTLSGTGQTYYETGCAILVFMTLGRWLEASGRLRASDAVRALEALLPDTVAVDREGRRLEVKPDAIQPGDLLSVTAGQRIAADCVIEKGCAGIDEQLITGESTPIAKSPGDLVRAGSLNLDGALALRAVATGAGSTLGRLIELLENTLRSRTRLQRLTDRIATMFVPVTVILALIAAARAWPRGFDDAVMNAMAVLLIACPCALGIATPMAIWVAVGTAAKRHILIRDSQALEDLAGIKAVCFDKTGTLTLGQPVVASCAIDSRDPAERERILAQSAGIAAGSAHILAQAITRYAKVQRIIPTAVVESRTIPGRGLIARTNGTTLALGSPELMIENRLHAPETLQRSLEGIHRSAQSVACIGWGGVVRGVFAFDETVRPEAGGVLASLQRSGLAVSVLTGDHAARGKRLSESLNVPVLAEQLPADKVHHLEQARRTTGPVAMIGDGLNDAPALAAADVGIALGCGADLTRESAAICLLGNDLKSVPWLFDLSRRTVRTIKSNLFWAFAYNLVGIALAMTGRLNPVFAAAAMVASSLLVTANSLRLRNVPETAR
ncbi:MAG TPA: cation-translocating P-type ATPase [Phycisphaerae bacterium]|nr:cation-translocating P-type ATPase [Phycisphaerae bacterium]